MSKLDTLRDLVFETDKKKRRHWVGTAKKEGFNHRARRLILMVRGTES